MPPTSTWRDAARRAAAVFYTISRIPDLFAAGMAVGGSPEAAIDTGRIFAVNFTNAPVLWVSSGAGDEALADKLKAAGMNLEWRSAAGLHQRPPFSMAGRPRARAVSRPPWIAKPIRPPSPAAIWLQPTKFDVSERNDVLPSTRIAGGSGAALDLGGFSYQARRPRPRPAGLPTARQIQRPAEVGRPHRGARWQAHRQCRASSARP